MPFQGFQLPMVQTQGVKELVLKGEAQNACSMTLSHLEIRGQGVPAGITASQGKGRKAGQGRGHGAGLVTACALFSFSS